MKTAIGHTMCIHLWHHILQEITQTSICIRLNLNTWYQYSLQVNGDLNDNVGSEHGSEALEVNILMNEDTNEFLLLLLPGMEWTLLRVLKLQRMVGEQQKITRVCTIKMSLFTIKSSWSCSHVADESRHTDGKYVMPERLNCWLASQLWW